MGTLTTKNPQSDRLDIKLRGKEATAVAARSLENEPVASKGSPFHGASVPVTNRDGSYSTSIAPSLNSERNKAGSTPSETRPRNQVLASLSQVAWSRLLPHLRHCLLYPGQFLHHAHQPVKRIYFPNGGLVSLVTGMQDGAQVEIGVVGSEGIVGTMALLGCEMSFNHAIVQVAGNACWLPADVLRDEVRWNEKLQEIVYHQCQILTAQAAQSALCNRLHTVEERLNRWLLNVCDRISSHEIEITHSQIARMLGTRRSSITLALGDLEEAGLVSMTRGRITLLDQEKIANGTCECYGLLRNHFNPSQDALAR